MNDTEEFKHSIYAMEICGVNADEKHNLFKIVSAILHLGNIPFVKGYGEGSEVKDKRELDIAAKLLDISSNQLDEALCKPRIKAGTEYVKTHLTIEKAAFSRDALSKAIYGRLFLWIVKRMNKILNTEKAALFIGILDIAGFEIFVNNSFEQMCINYTNEKLQQFFNHHMFKLEQEEYIKEKINWTFIDFGLDSQMTIDLIDKRPAGILVTLDEETIVPKATDETFVAKLHEHHERNPGYEKVQFSKINFKLHHYAGVVEYDATQWLEKNKDPLQEDLELALKKSANPFIADLFGDEFVPKLDRPPTPNDSRSRSPAAKSGDARKKGAQFITVSAHHKEQLNHLMATLQATNPHFVRCIIPNHRQKANDLDAHIVLDQLRCNGVLEGIRIAVKVSPTESSTLNS
jgi:myosin heavy subunit